MSVANRGDEYRVIAWTADETLITDDEHRLELAERISSSDQQAELKVGLTVSHAALTYQPGEQRGDLLIIHDSNRAGISLGADSDWGDYDPTAGTLTLDAGPVLHVAGTLVYADDGAEDVTAEDIRRLLDYSPRADATLIRWSDTGEIDVVPAVLFSDISYSERNREYEVLATAADLRQSGTWDIEHPTAEDFEAFARQINEA